MSAAVNALKPDLLKRHDVEVAKLGTVVHYTSLHALFAMIQEDSPPLGVTNDVSRDQRPTDSRFLRLYDSANLNDPSEGTYFLKRFTRAYNLVKVPAYIASFITPDNANNDPDVIRNNLVFWRHYGNDGRGCSISVQADRFADNAPEFQLRRVSYGDSAATQDAEQLRTLINRLEPFVDVGPNPNIDDLDSTTPLQQQVAATILESFGEIPYLYKSSAYQYEHECRIVALQSAFDNYGGIHHTFQRSLGGVGRPRMYGQHPSLRITNLLSTGTTITLGPAVPNPDNVQYALEQLLESVDIGGLSINVSKIPYRRTS